MRERHARAGGPTHTAGRERARAAGWLRRPPVGVPPPCLAGCRAAPAAAASAVLLLACAGLYLFVERVDREVRRGR